RQEPTARGCGRSGTTTINRSSAEAGCVRRRSRSLESWRGTTRRGRRRPLPGEGTKTGPFPSAGTRPPSPWTISPRTSEGATRVGSPGSIPTKATSGDASAPGTQVTGTRLPRTDTWMRSGAPSGVGRGFVRPSRTPRPARGSLPRKGCRRGSVPAEELATISLHHIRDRCEARLHSHLHQDVLDMLAGCFLRDHKC